MDLQKLMQRMDKDRVQTLNEMKLRAKYKIQIWFKSDRSLSKPLAFSLTAWQSGKRLHGGGDEMMFLCRRHQHARPVAPFEVGYISDATHHPTKRGCGMFIPGENNVGACVVCPHCGTKHNPEDVGDAVFFRLTANNAAMVLATWFRKLESNADLYAKYSPQDPRTVMMAKNYNPATARAKKGLTIYPLKNILDDVSHGSTIESRFRAFILA